VTSRDAGRRQAAAGEVLLYIREPLACRIPARLIDVNPAGFRAAHHFAALSAGQEIRYRRDGEQGRARVVWTRVLSGSVETGFAVISSL
jgi:hypothetical protein